MKKEVFMKEVTGGRQESVSLSTPTLMKELKECLASTYVLYVKTQNFHWNVTGPSFYSLHLLSEKQYEELGEAVDEIAERIRALGEKAPASLDEFKNLSSLEEKHEEHTGYELLAILIEDHKRLALDLRKKVETANEEGDPGTADLFTRRALDHEKYAWMLASHVA